MRGIPGGFFETVGRKDSGPTETGNFEELELLEPRDKTVSLSGSGGWLGAQS